LKTVIPFCFNLTCFGSLFFAGLNKKRNIVFPDFPKKIERRFFQSQTISFVKRGVRVSYDFEEKDVSVRFYDSSA